jgi:hypothetical protein
MKTFEERYTIWLEGTLTGPELEKFERSLPDRAAAETEKRDFEKMKRLLSRHSAAPALCNPDFFNYQLTEKIVAEQRREAQGRPRSRFVWPLQLLAWAGVFCLVIFFGLFKTVIPDPRDRGALPESAMAANPARQPHPLEVNTQPARYDAKILHVHTSEPGVSATAVQSDKDGVSVIWLDGLEDLPANYNLQ